MRISTLLLAVAAVAVLVLLVAPVRNEAGYGCGDIPAAILLSPGYSDGDIPKDSNGRSDTCAVAAKRRGLMAIVVGASGAIIATYMVKKRRSSEATST